MFTGIVAGKGRIQKIEKMKSYTRLVVKSSFSLRGTKLGDSIAVDGCCLTVTKFRDNAFTADISPETLRRSTLGSFKAGTEVNLERPLRLTDRLGGHLVQGHVDGVGEILAKRLVKASPESYYLMEILVPKHLQTYMVEKGSVAVDGVSLTVNGVKRGKISLCIIPHTREKTTLTTKKVGARVNIEADILLKYLGKMLKANTFRSARRH